jgi:porin
VSTTWLWLSGRDASEDLVGNFLTVSNIAGFNTLRMFELWFQQELLDDKVSIRFGQLSADSEFLISDYAGLFINGTFGWPAIAYTNIPEGGAGYPMGTLGVRLALNPVDWFTFQTAVFQGNVFAQDVNRHGFRWRLDAQTGYTFLNEGQFRWNHREEEAGLPGQLKSGVWFQTGASADVLTDSTSSGNAGFYFVLDQMIYREPSGSSAAGLTKDGKSVVDGKSGKSFKSPVALEKSDQGLGFFGRVGFTPADRNFVNFYFDTGLSYKGLIPTRDNDTVGIGFGYAQLSNGARGSLTEEGASPIGAEMVIEFTYQAEITPWLVVQPDLQYIINPGGASDLNNALVIGGRAAITF